MQHSPKRALVVTYDRSQINYYFCTMLQSWKSRDLIRHMLDLPEAHTHLSLRVLCLIQTCLLRDQSLFCKVYHRWVGRDIQVALEIAPCCSSRTIRSNEGGATFLQKWHAWNCLPRIGRCHTNKHATVKRKISNGRCNHYECFLPQREWVKTGFKTAMD